MNSIRRIYLLPVLAVALVLCGCSTVSRRLVSRDNNVRARALQDIRKMDEKARGKVALNMAKTLADKKSDARYFALTVRDFALAALEELGPAAGSAAPELIPFLSDYSVSFRVSGILEKLDSATPELIQALKNTDFSISNSARQIFAARGARAVPVLIEALDHADPLIRENAAKALGDAGADAKDAIPALVASLRDADEDVRIWSSISLTRLGEPVAEWALGALGDASPAVRADAARALSKPHPAPPRAAPALLAAVKDENVEVRRLAAQALASFAYSSRENLPAGFIPVLIALSKDGDAELRRPGIDALGLLASESGEAFAVVVSALDDPDPGIQMNAAGRLKALGPKADKAAPALRKSLKSGELCVRVWSALALKEIDPALGTDPDIMNALAKENHDACVKVMPPIEPILEEAVKAFEPETIPELKDFFRQQPLNTGQ